MRDGLRHDTDIVIYFFFFPLLKLALAFIQVQFNPPPSPYVLHKQPAGNLPCQCSVRSYSRHPGMVLGTSLAAACPLTQHLMQSPHGWQQNQREKETLARV